MKLIGLIGGMSWESTELYYRLLNEGVRARLGGLHSARCVIHSVDFAEIEALQREGEWDAAGQKLENAARGLESAGAEFLVLCTNTMHIAAGAIEESTSIPLLHIVDVTAQAIKRAGLVKVGLLGTAFTMEEPFYAERMARHGIEVITPPHADRRIVHDVIYDELCMGVVKQPSKAQYERIISGLIAAGAQGIVSGCTEIELLVDESICPAPLFRTTALHVEAALDRSLE